MSTLPTTAPPLSSTAYQEAELHWEEGERAFWASEAGGQAQQRQRRYVPDFDTDGCFKIDAVIPGT